MTSIAFPYGANTLTLETGEIARQATGAVVASLGDTTVLVTVVCAKEPVVGKDFFPLSVHYQERTYSAGKIPGGFFKREGRPTERETLTSRLIDRLLRPLFPKEFNYEVQVIATVMSLDPSIDPDIPSIIGAAAALSISGLPFHGPVGAARVGYLNGGYVLNPSAKQMKDSKLDLVVAGTESAVLMVESEANELSEAVMLGAVTYGHEQMQQVIQQIRTLAASVKFTAWKWIPPETNAEAFAAVRTNGMEAFRSAYRIPGKLARQDQVAKERAELLMLLSGGDSPRFPENIVRAGIEKLERQVVRGQILAGAPRIDGRDVLTVRPITARVGVLPRTHGSALFTRGETQVLVIATLGTPRDVQIIDAIEGERKEPFMLHYNFPPYAVAETGQVGTPKRREIGHGRLAKRGIQAVMPDMSKFAYTVRVVSEITESNGSSSMASVCGSSLALMDAGVPIRAPVAGIAMGLIKEGDQYAILTDILGDEDHFGDMDFKVAGTQEGVTALQMDIKIEGITREIMERALAQAREGRLHILGEMKRVLDKTREDMSQYAPRIITLRVHPDKIRDVIGKGGVMIRALTEETGATIDVSDDGVIKIAAVDLKAAQEAKRRIEEITADAQVGKIYQGKVIKLMEFGAFVTIMPGRDGLVHISQISNERVQKVSDKLREGEIVQVKVMEVDKQGRIRLSMKPSDLAQ